MKQQPTLKVAEGLLATECMGVLSTSKASLSGRSGVAEADWRLALMFAEDSSPAEGCSVSGAMVSLMRSPSPVGVSPTFTAGLADLQHIPGGLKSYIFNLSMNLCAKAVDEAPCSPQSCLVPATKAKSSLHDASC